MRSYEGIRVLVLGLGDSGLAMAAWMTRYGASVQVWDSRANPPQLEKLRAELPAAEFCHGDLPLTALNGVQMVLKSPGLSPLDARIAPLLTQAVQTGVPVQGELGLFAQALADLKQSRRYAPAVLAITGTNGKTTTTCMTALLVERAGKRVVMAGNIGPSMLTTLSQALDQEPDQVPEQDQSAPEQPLPEGALQPSLAAADSVAVDQALELAPEFAPEPVVEPEAEIEATQTTMEMVDALLNEAPLPIDPPRPKGPVFEFLPEVWVLELSSFQLDEVRGFEPTAAAVLNLSQDHLDWHGDMKAYAQAKARVFGEAALMVINRDDPAVEAMVPSAVMVKQGRGRAAKSVGRRVARFGLDSPDRPGDFGLVTEGGMAWLVRAREQDETLRRKKGEEEEEITLQRLMPADALRVRGRHNAANALAALALATAADCALAPMLHGLREYRGEPHRVEHVATLNGVDFYDDSKGTNVGATVAAINGLGADHAPAKLVLILGGDGKGQDFSPLAAGVARHARAVALIGRDAEQIRAALADSGVPMQNHASLEAATQWCLAQAHSGDSVLLSPACASLDMFRNYAHRAEVFVGAVQALAQDLGQGL
ncbi:UDP-N-acetylmuramoyl-L-alanine--D-glutamate ligase [Paucibacter sp. B2R-40]|uniref:UDP-N-acetylmuramoyl-L-alanine--D-glutamate ligase n=1 Tax=Paucibacter sp. B2R-40 TaxID=2893554 RepID=UPI0021E4BC20|nr:UDP-N-acetylmuramoyl-L-alanine--D-glutamate ligase [Paucibacter sp. B2R-40]MCV2356736.1 UDP-N-acetylmuramoyl-L-alanine--D-glutamate ligase [Paucibacter sp. B2R-40]